MGALAWACALRKLSDSVQASKASPDSQMEWEAYSTWSSRTGPLSRENDLKPVGRQEADSVHCTGMVTELLVLPSTDTLTSAAPADTPDGITKSILVMPTAPGTVPE